MHIPTSLLCLQYTVYHRILWDGQKNYFGNSGQVRAGLRSSLFYPLAVGIHKGFVLGPFSFCLAPLGQILHSFGIVCHVVPRMCTHLPAYITSDYNKRSVSDCCQVRWTLNIQATVSLSICPFTNGLSILETGPRISVLIRRFHLMCTERGDSNCKYWSNFVIFKCH